MNIRVTFEVETRFAIPARSRVIVNVDGETKTSDWAVGESNMLLQATIQKLRATYPRVPVNQTKTTREMKP